MLLSLLPALTNILDTALDKAFPDEVEREKIKADLKVQLMAMDKARLEAASNVIITEAKGDSWLQRSWRPIVMLWLAGLVGAYWLGFSPENLPPEAINGLLNIVQVGLGGFVIGRSGEKMVKAWKEPELKSVSGPQGIF